MHTATRSEQGVQVSRLNRHVFHGKRALNDRNDHATVSAGIDIPMGCVPRDQHGLSRFDGLMLCPNDNNPVTLQAKHDFIRDRMAVQAILLAWLKAVNVAMELIRLPDPLPNETVRREGFQAFESLLFHRMRFLLLIAR